MKKLILLMVLFSLSCKKEEVKPIDNGNDVCKCGTIQSVSMYAPWQEFTFTIKNDCTGNLTEALNATYNEAGNKMCLAYKW
jgi:hypothetical protein